MHKKSLDAAKNQLNDVLQRAHRLIDETGPNEEMKIKLIDTYDNLASRRQALQKLQVDSDNATLLLQKSVTTFGDVLQCAGRVHSGTKVSLNVSSAPSSQQ